MRRGIGYGYRKRFPPQMKYRPVSPSDPPKSGAGNRMTAVELFCGIGGFRVAADAVKLRTVWANDIDPKASRVYRDRFGDAALVEADINSVLDQIPPHDLLSGGFPCQPFSSAGKKLGTNDPRGTLFQSIVEVIRRRAPRFFVLENVKRLLSMEKGRHFATIVTALSSLGYRVEWRLLNAMHFGLAQNRQRVVITGHREPSDDHFSVLATQEDLAALGDRELEAIHDGGQWIRIKDHGERFPVWGMVWNGRFTASNLPVFSDAAPGVTLAEVLESDVPKQFDFTDSMGERLSMNSQVGRFVSGVEILSNQGGGARMGYTIFGTRGLSPTLTASTSRHYERYRVGERYRRLTNVEYARLQGFPDDHCQAVAVYDQYALYGNAVPPPMMEWVFRRVMGSRTAIPAPSSSQMSLLPH